MTRQERKENWMLGNHEKALAAFMGTVVEARERLVGLTAYMDDHMGYDPEGIDWGHVGDATYFLTELAELTDRAFKRGEYAE
jgi:hypothetical protein